MLITIYVHNVVNSLLILNVYIHVCVLFTLVVDNCNDTN